MLVNNIKSNIKKLNLFAASKVLKILVFESDDLVGSNYLITS